MELVLDHCIFAASRIQSSPSTTFDRSLGASAPCLPCGRSSSESEPTQSGFCRLFSLKYLALSSCSSPSSASLSWRKNSSDGLVVFPDWLVLLFFLADCVTVFRNGQEDEDRLDPDAPEKSGRSTREAEGVFDLVCLLLDEMSDPLA